MSHTYPDDSPIIDSKDCPKTIEAMEEYSGQFCRIHGDVFRRNLVPKESANDLLTNYSIFDEEMVAHSPIFEANSTDER